MIRPWSCDTLRLVSVSDNPINQRDVCSRGDNLIDIDMCSSLSDDVTMQKHLHPVNTPAISVGLGNSHSSNPQSSNRLMLRISSKAAAEFKVNKFARRPHFGSHRLLHYATCILLVECGYWNREANPPETSQE